VFAIALVALTFAASSCTWREGRYVYYEVYDADTDDDADERDGDGDGQYPTWMTAEELQGLIHSDDPELIVDIRPLKAYQIGHIKGALCDPWDDGFADPLPELDGNGFLVLYDNNGDIVEEAASTLASSFNQPVHMLRQGFAGWEAAGYEIETGGD